jgi:hypothetical protein
MDKDQVSAAPADREAWMKEHARLSIHLENAAYRCGSARTGADITAAQSAIATARAALLAHISTAAPAVQQDGWRPIESAPEDGTLLLLGNADEGWTTEARFDSERRGWWEINTHWTDAADGQVYPTHWQPLPPPPGESTGSAPAEPAPAPAMVMLTEEETVACLRDGMGDEKLEPMPEDFKVAEAIQRAFAAKNGAAVKEQK